ncbi:hypothetical protein JCM11251_001366 [Rhodosporidiobolus azoricus]
MPTEMPGDEEETLAEMEDFPAYSIPLDQLAFVLRREDWNNDEQYSLVQLEPAEQEGKPPTLTWRKDITICPFDTSYYYYDHELPKIPLEQRNFRSWLQAHAPSVRYIDLSAETSVPVIERYKANIVVNPASGAKTAKEWLSLVESLLSVACGGSLPYPGDDYKEEPAEDAWLKWAISETAAEGDGERIGQQIAQEIKEQQDGSSKSATIVLGGDGTVHELINGLLSVSDNGGVKSIPTDLVVFPLGTANALYYHLFPPTSPSFPSTGPLAFLHSFLNFLEAASPSSGAPLGSKSTPLSGPPTPHGEALPLPIAQNSLPNGKTVFTSVVTSAALHANILLDAEALRASQPGVERFKLAAQQNAQRWWSGDLTLKKDVKRYDSTEQQWVDKSDGVELGGAFSYLTSALVDRFESNFVVAPFRSKDHALSPDSSSSIDLVLIRPMRHAQTAALVRAGKEEEAKKAFVDRVWAVSGKMYEGGKHVDLVYDEQEREDKGEEGKEVAEIYRCSEFEWKPTTDADKKDRIVCLDGALHDLGNDGSLQVKVLGPQESNLRVWA